MTGGDQAVAKVMSELLAGQSDAERLLDHPAYEPRTAAMCILDFKARRRIDDDQRHQLYRTYMARHDRITTWDMVDRAAPRVVGGYLAGRAPTPSLQVPRCPAQRVNSPSLGTSLPAV